VGSGNIAPRSLTTSSPPNQVASWQHAGTSAAPQNIARPPPASLVPPPLFHLVVKYDQGAYPVPVAVYQAATGLCRRLATRLASCKRISFCFPPGANSAQSPSCTCIPGLVPLCYWSNHYVARKSCQIQRFYPWQLELDGHSTCECPRLRQFVNTSCCRVKYREKQRLIPGSRSTHQELP
jgi:hypothetical protein